MSEEVYACAQCVKAKRNAASWRYEGESCGHVECPNRRPLTAAPSHHAPPPPDHDANRRAVDL